MVTGCMSANGLQTGPVQVTFGLPPLALQDTLEFMLGMKYVESHLDRHRRGSLLALACSRPRLVDQLHAPFQARACIRNDTLNTWPMGQERTPTCPRAVRAALSRHPRHTVGFHRHEDGLTMEKDFIQAQHQHPPLTALIEYRQQSPSSAARLGDPASHCRPTWDAPLRQENGQQEDDLTQTQAHRRARRRKLLLFDLGQLLRSDPGLPQGLVFRAQALIVDPQRLVTDATRWLVRVVPNKYPAFEGNAPMVVTHLGPVFTQAPASGVHEVLVLSPEHQATWADLSDARHGVAGSVRANPEEGLLP